MTHLPFQVIIVQLPLPRLGTTHAKVMYVPSFGIQFTIGKRNKAGHYYPAKTKDLHDYTADPFEVHPRLKAMHDGEGWNLQLLTAYTRAKRIYLEAQSNAKS